MVSTLGPTSLESPFNADVKVWYTWYATKHSFCAICDLLAVSGLRKSTPSHVDDQNSVISGAIPPKLEKTCLRYEWTAVQNFTPTRKASAEKSLTVHKTSASARSISRHMASCWRQKFGHSWGYPQISEDLSEIRPNRRAKFHADR